MGRLWFYDPEYYSDYECDRPDCAGRAVGECPPYVLCKEHFIELFNFLEGEEPDSTREAD